MLRVLAVMVGTPTRRVENTKLRGQVRDAIIDFTIEDGPRVNGRGLDELRRSEVYIK